MPFTLPSFARQQALSLDSIDLQEAVVSRLDAVTATQVLTLGKKFAQPHVLLSVLEKNRRALDIDDQLLSALTAPAPVSQKFERENLEDFTLGHGLLRCLLTFVTLPLSIPGHFAVEAVKAGSRRQLGNRLPKMPAFSHRYQLRGIYRRVSNGLKAPLPAHQGGTQVTDLAESIRNARQLIGEEGRRLAIVQRAFSAAVKYGWHDLAAAALLTGCVEESTLATSSPRALQRLARALARAAAPSTTDIVAMAELVSARTSALRSLHEALATGACRGLDSLPLAEVEWLLTKPTVNAVVAARPELLLRLLPQIDGESALSSPSLLTALRALWQRASAGGEEAVLRALAPKAELLGGDASGSNRTD